MKEVVRRQAGSSGEDGARGRLCRPIPGRFGTSVCRHLRPACEVLAVTGAGAGGRPPPPTGARAVKHGPRSHLGIASSQGQSRGGTPEGERALQGARRNASCGGYGLRLTAFRILLFVSLIRRWRNGPVIVTEKPVHRRAYLSDIAALSGRGRIAKSRVANGAFSIATHARHSPPASLGRLGAPRGRDVCHHSSQ